MKRRWFAAVGALVVVLDAALALRVTPTVSAIATVALIGVGGLLLIAGGFELGGDAVPWHALVGAAEVVFGGVFVVAWVPPALRADPTTTELVLALVGGINGIVLGLIGVDWFHGGGWFDLDVYEPGPLFGGRESADVTDRSTGGPGDPPD